MFSGIAKFWIGFSAYFSVWGFTRRHGLGTLYLIPAILNALIASLSLVMIVLYADNLSVWIQDYLGLDALEGNWSTLGKLVTYLLVLGLSILIYLKVYKYLMLVLLSPVLSVVAERVQAVFHPELAAEGFSFGRFMKDFIRGFLLSLRNMLIELGLSMILFLVGLFIPFLSPITTVCIILIEAYFAGFAMLDYHNESLRLGLRERKNYGWDNRSLACGNGLGFWLLTLIPVLGVLLAPVTAVIAAGIAAEHKKA